MTFGAELLSEWSYISTPCICPYSMHRDTFTFIKHKETTGCKKDMLFICLICILYVHFCQKTKEITVVLIVFLSGDWQFSFEKKGTA